MMDSTRVTVDSVHASKPFPAQNKFEDKPMNPVMIVIWMEIYQNLAPIYSSFGQGQAGFPGIMIQQVLYVQALMNPLNLLKILVSTPMRAWLMHPLLTKMSSSCDTKCKNNPWTHARLLYNAFTINFKWPSMKTILPNWRTQMLVSPIFSPLTLQSHCRPIHQN